MGKKMYVKVLPGPSLFSLTMNPLRCPLQMVSYYGSTRKSPCVFPWYNPCKPHVTLYCTEIWVLLIACPEFHAIWSWGMQLSFRKFRRNLRRISLSLLTPKVHDLNWKVGEKNTSLSSLNVLGAFTAFNVIKCKRL